MTKSAGLALMMLFVPNVVLAQSPQAPLVLERIENPFVAASGMVQSIDHPKKRGLRVFTLPVKIDGERPQAVVAEPLKR